MGGGALSENSSQEVEGFYSNGTPSLLSEDGEREEGEREEGEREEGGGEGRRRRGGEREEGGGGA